MDVTHPRHILAHAPNSGSGRYDLLQAAEAAGIGTELIDRNEIGGLDLDRIIELSRRATAFRSAGGPLAAAIARGAAIKLHGPGPEWFVNLPRDVTGRDWKLVDLNGARKFVERTPSFIKLADLKIRGLPARRYRDMNDFNAAIDQLRVPASVNLLATSDWLEIHSEYRVFCRDRTVAATSPYLVEGEEWSPFLFQHRASFHEAAERFALEILDSLGPPMVPPSSVLDIARLENGRFILLEVNQVWSSGLYSCDPAAVLHTVLAAGSTGGANSRWLWKPDLSALGIRPR